MTLKLDLEPRFEPCCMCQWLDDSGSVLLQDDQRVAKVFCRQCASDLLKLVLSRDVIHAVARSA